MYFKISLESGSNTGRTNISRVIGSVHVTVHVSVYVTPQEMVTMGAVSPERTVTMATVLG